MAEPDNTEAELQAAIDEFFASQGLVDPEEEAKNAALIRVGQETGGGLRGAERRAAATQVLELKKPQPDRLSLFERETQDQLIAMSDQSGGDFLPRLRASLPITPEGRIKAVQAEFGEENTVVLLDSNRDPDGFIIMREGQKPLMLDPSAFSFSEVAGDIADVGGDIIETVPGMVAGLATAGAGPLVAGATAAGVDAVASAARQGLAEVFTPGDDLTVGQRVGEVATTVAGGLVGEGIGVAARAAKRAPGKALAKSLITEGGRTASFRTAGDVLVDQAGREAVPAGGVVTKKVARDAGQEFVQEGARLGEKIGQDLTIGQLTGSKNALFLEGLMRQYPATREAWDAQDVAQAKGLQGFLEKTIEKTAGPKVAAEAAGRSIAGAYDGMIKGLVSARSKVANKMFGQAAELAGKDRVIPVSNTLAAIDGLASKYSGDFATDTSELIIKKMERLRNAFLENSGGENAVSVTSMSRSLSDWGKRASGAGHVIKDLDKGTDRQIATEIFKALRKDLDDAVDGAGVTSAASAKLRDARDVFRGMSEHIEASRNPVLEKIFDDVSADSIRGPENFLRTIKGAGESQVTRGMRALERMDPTAAAQARGAFMRDLLSSVEPGAASGLEKAGVNVSPTSFANKFSKNKDKLQAVFAGDPKAFSDMQQAVMFAQRLADRAGSGGSQTTPMRWMLEALPIVGKASLAELPARAVKWATASGFAKMWISKEGRREFLGLIRPQPSKRRKQEVLRVLTKLSAIATRPDDIEDESTILTATDVAGAAP